MGERRRQRNLADLSALVPAKDGPPSLAWCLVPVADVMVDHDSWNVCGLQGTGSKTVADPDPLFVPEHRVLPLGAIFSGKVPGLEMPGNGQARFGYPTFGPTALVAPIVGMAQGAIDAFADTARGAPADGAARRLRTGAESRSSRAWSARPPRGSTAYAR